MLSDVDAGLARLLGRDVLDAADIEVAFDAPTKDWAATRSTPTVDAFLYDVREDPRRRQHGEHLVRGTNGEPAGRRGPPRIFRLGYLLTAWTQRPEDEHRLLGAVLSCLLCYDTLPAELLPPALGALGHPVTMTVGLPPADGRSVTEFWSALGGHFKPALDVVLSVPVPAGMTTPLAPPVEHPALVSVRDTGGRP